MSAITTREEIIDEIRHLARRIGRSPGKDFFQKETRIPEGHWYGRYWLSWGDALKEAGLEANQVPPKIPDNELLEHYAKAVRHFRKIPSKAQLKMHRAGGNPDLPADTTFRKRFGNKQSRNAALWKFVQEKSQFADLIDLVPEPKDDDSAANRSEDGFVYLFKMGQHYKIGRSMDVDKRLPQVSGGRPEPVIELHRILTDDPPGIEKYWLRRFADKKIKGEWFALSPLDVKAFKRRRHFQ